MGRIYSEIKVNSHSLWALFDTGAKNSYVVATSAKGSGLLTQPVAKPHQVGLGGRTRSFDRSCVVDGLIENRHVNFLAYLIDDLGCDDKGRPVDALFGALAMQQWSIRPVPDEERLDLSHYTEEFIEY